MIQVESEVKDDDTGEVVRPNVPFMYSVGQKSNPLRIFTNISANSKNFFNQVSNT